MELELVLRAGMIERDLHLREPILRTLRLERLERLERVAPLGRDLGEGEVRAAELEVEQELDRLLAAANLHRSTADDGR